MSKELYKIDSFLQLHHILSLSTCRDNQPNSCTLFYVFDKTTHSFVVASSKDTQHIQNILQNPKISGTVALETKSVGKIQGVQFMGEFLKLDDKNLKKLYFKAFPYALAMNPTLWQIKIENFKMTDNKLGFGKKLIWQDSFE
jgi:uncharacterized protein YhbP (UPF0306 family)